MEVQNVAYEPHYAQLDEIFAKYSRHKKLTPQFKHKITEVLHPEVFCNLFIHGYFQRCYPREEVELKEGPTSLLRDLYRIEDVQRIFKMGQEPGVVTDHIVFSALLQLVFGALKYKSSVKLDDVLLAIFVFNSATNLQLISKGENSEKATREKKFITEWKKCLLEKRKEHPNVKLQVYLQQSFSDAEVARFRQEIKPSLLLLREHCASSSTIISMAGYVIQAEKDRLDEWKNRRVTINKKTKRELKVYASTNLQRFSEFGPLLFSNGIGTPYCPKKFITHYDVDELHVTLFIVLVRLGRMREKRLTDKFDFKDYPP